VAALALSVFPGCGHLYTGRPARAVLWGVLFLGGFMFPAMFAYYLWSYTSQVHSWLGMAFALFVLLAGRGPFFLALRGGAAPGSSRHAPAAAHVLALYAALVTFLVGAELSWFEGRYFVEATVRSSRLEPFLRAGEPCRVALSVRVRPVHGDIVLYRSGEAPPGEAPSAEPHLLGRVLAEPADSVELRAGKLLVNGLEFRFADPEFQRLHRELGGAGSDERRRRLLAGLPFLPGAPPELGSEAAGQARVVSLSGPDWGPFLVPERSFLLLPDLASGGAAVALEGEPCAHVVARERILGRVAF
jgi:hypothetical protein